MITKQWLLFASLKLKMIRFYWRCHKKTLCLKYQILYINVWFLVLLQYHICKLGLKALCLFCIITFTLKNPFGYCYCLKWAYNYVLFLKITWKLYNTPNSSDIKLLSIISYINNYKTQQWLIMLLWKCQW